MFRLTLAGLCVAAVGCAPLADFRDLERKVGSLDRRMQGPTDQQARLAELGTEVSELREQIASLKGSIDQLQYELTQLRQGSPGGAGRPGGQGAGDPSSPGATPGSQQGSGGSRPNSTAGPDGDGGGVFQGPPPPSSDASSSADIDSPRPRGSGAAGGGAGASDEVKSYEEAFRSYRAGDTDQAIDRFRSFLQTYPSSAYGDNAMFWLGECYFKKGDHERAVLAFEDLVKKYPNGGKVPDALYRQGIALLEMGGTSGQKEAYRSAAREIFERIVRDHADSDRAPEARRQLERLGT